MARSPAGLRTGAAALVVAAASGCALPHSAATGRSPSDPPATPLVRTSWHIVRPPATGCRSPIAAVGASAPGDVWAVGRCGAAHWDGRRWHTYPVPDALSTVAPIAADDAWAGGGADLLHWDGRRWIRTTTGLPPRHLRVDAVQAGSAANVWVRFVSGLGEQMGLARWDGRRWRPVAQPDRCPFPGDGDRADFAADPDGGVWVTGDDDPAARPKRGSPEDRFGSPALCHYDGRRWSAVRVPRAADYVDVDGITLSGGRVFANVVEGTAGNTVDEPPAVLRWDPRTRRWTRPPAGPGEEQTGTGDQFGDAVTDGRGGRWVLDFDGTGRPDAGYLRHWDTRRWTLEQVPSPVRGHRVRLTALGHVPGTATVWAAATDHGRSFLAVTGR